jgi:hypothetical protein
VFSEYSLQKPEAWNFVSPILAENGGWSVFVYTPRGMNHGWSLLQQGKANPKWFVQVLTVDDTDAINREAIEDERLTNPEDLFQQEYYCRFVDGAGQVFRGIDRNLWDGDMQPIEGRFYRLGVDLAKHQDYTVITPFDLHTFKAGRPIRFNQMDWNLIKARIEATARRFNNAQILMDTTGVGDPIFDDLSRIGMSIEPYRFTEQSRTDLLMNLALLIEQDRIKISDDEVAVDELRSFRYELTDRGRTRMGCPDGLHDDCVMSLALATWGINVPYKRQTNSFGKRLSGEFSNGNDYDGLEQHQFSRFHYNN